MCEMITVISDFRKQLCHEFSDEHQVSICRFCLKSLDKFSFFCFLLCLTVTKCCIFTVVLSFFVSMSCLIPSYWDLIESRFLFWWWCTFPINIGGVSTFTISSELFQKQGVAGEW